MKSDIILAGSTCLLIVHLSKHTVFVPDILATRAVRIFVVLAMSIRAPAFRS